MCLGRPAPALGARAPLPSWALAGRSGHRDRQADSLRKPACLMMASPFLGGRTFFFRDLQHQLPLLLSVDKQCDCRNQDEQLVSFRGKLPRGELHVLSLAARPGARAAGA